MKFKLNDFLLVTDKIILFCRLQEGQSAGLLANLDKLKSLLVKNWPTASLRKLPNDDVVLFWSRWMFHFFKKRRNVSVQSLKVKRNQNFNFREK
jgi:hypothetical protein